MQHQTIAGEAAMVLVVRNMNYLFDLLGSETKAKLDQTWIDVISKQFLSPVHHIAQATETLCQQSDLVDITGTNKRFRTSYRMQERLYENAVMHLERMNNEQSLLESVWINAKMLQFMTSSML